MNNFFPDFSNEAQKKKVFRTLCWLACCFIFFHFVHYFTDAFFCNGITGYMVAHHLINYDFGLMPRALYGATVGELTQVLPKAAYLLVWFVICLVPYVIYFCVYLRVRKNCRHIGFLDAIAAYALVLPTTYLPLSDFFRLDVVLLNWFLVCALILWTRHWLRYLVPFIMIIITLTHEAAIFMFLPTLCGIAFFKAEKKRDIVLTVLLCFGVLCSCAVYWYARQQLLHLQPTVIDAFIQGRNNMQDIIIGNEKLTLADHFLSVESGYIHYTFTKNLTFVWCMGVLFAIPFFVIAIGIVLYFWRAIYNSNQERIFRWKLIFLFFTTLSNICLFIGCDYNRWVASWLFVNIFLLFLLLGDKNVNELPPVATKHKSFFFIMLFIFFISGPGSCHTFSRFTNNCGTAAGLTLQKVCHTLFHK